MPNGTHVVLTYTFDYALPPAGSTGVIQGKDDQGDPIVRWDDYKGISPIFPGNVIERI